MAKMLLSRPITIELSKTVPRQEQNPNILRAHRRSRGRLAGGDNRARTGDLLRAKQALSQLSYIPTQPRCLVGLRGVEPLTSRLSGVRSNHS